MTSQERERLRSLPASELDRYAEGIRRTLVDTVAENGGHLASNLGVVELTMALHRVFDTPRDKIIWDVGHQSYVHKLLTGRRERFSTLRTYGGLSGFPKESESLHDAFNTGHSTTSISVAVGMARARDLLGEDYHVVAVIGDGALTGGMAWEALNDAGHRKDRVIVVLNDNTMSIRPNVGAMSAYLARLRTQPRYGRFKRRLLQCFGESGPLFNFANRIKKFLKYLLIPGVFFEEMDWTYLGPVDGHNVVEMEKVFRQARGMHEPVLIHVCTQKGKGYRPAMERPQRFHGPGPFHKDTGEEKAGFVRTCDIIAGDTILDCAKENPRICAITAAMSDGCGLHPFAQCFPRRFFDVGIAEEHAVTMAAGLAAGGMLPYVCIYATFLQRAYDQLIHDVCLTRKQVVLAVSHTGLTGEDGETHQGIFTFSYLTAIPHMTVLAPATRGELSAMLRLAPRVGGPVAVCYGKKLPDGELPPEDALLSGRWEKCLDAPAADTVILAVGAMVENALSAARETEGRVAVVNCRWVKPLDQETLAWAAGHAYVITLEDNEVTGGFGASVAQGLAVLGFRGRLLNLGYQDAYVPHGAISRLWQDAGLDEPGVLASMKKLWEESDEEAPGHAFG